MWRVLLLCCLLLWGYSTPMGAEVARSADEIRPLLPGSRVPEVTFHDLEGRPVPLSAVVSEKPVVLIFYRGGW